MFLVSFLNSIGLRNVEMILSYYDEPFGELLKVFKVKLNEYDVGNSPYRFKKVFAFFLYAVDDGYQLMVKVCNW